MTVLVPYLGHMSTQPATARYPTWTLGDKLRKAREMVGLTQTEMALAIGISRQSVSNYEVGDYEPRRIVLNAWSTQTGVPIDWFMQDDGPDGLPVQPAGFTGNLLQLVA